MIGIKLKNYKDLERTVVFGNFQTKNDLFCASKLAQRNRNIHTIFKKGNMYFLYYGNTKEFVWTEDENGLKSGLYKYEDFSLSESERVVFKEDTFSPRSVYVLIMECENLTIQDSSTGVNYDFVV